MKGWAVQKTAGPMLTINTSYDQFLHKELRFDDRDDCTCVKIFSGVNVFEITTNSSLR